MKRTVWVVLVVSLPATRLADIDVKSRKGVVVLEGEVESREQRRQAEALARSIAGVRHVENRLKVQG